jgi:type IV pilus assembly protein PilX
MYSHTHKPLQTGAKGPARQRGVSLFIVLIVLLLALILVLGGLTITSFNESLVGNQSDQQRSHAAAEALMGAAQRDIRLNNGWKCLATGLGMTGLHETLKKTDSTAAACTVRFPADHDDYMQLLGKVGGVNNCASDDTYRGVCISESPTQDAFMSSAVNNGGKQLLSNGAGYNQFTASLGDGTWGGNAKAGSASLALGQGSDTQDYKGAYWVEIFPYHSMSGAIGGGVPVNVPVPDSMYPFIFRITAMAQGLRGGTVSVLRSYYVPYPCAPNATVGGCG